MTRSSRVAAHRVAMVLPRLDLGGMERTVLAQSAALRARGLEVHLVALREGGALTDDAVARGIPVHAGSAIHDAAQAVAFLETTARRLELTHLHSHTGTWWPAARAARRVRIPHLHTRHGFVESPTWRSRITEWLAARQTQSVICVSDALRHHTERTLGVPSDRTVLLRNGIDLSAIAARPAVAVSADAPPTLAMVCRLAAVKNVPLALQALATLRSTWPMITLHLVGDGPEREAIDAAAVSLGIRDAVRLYGADPLPWSRIPPDAVVLQTSDSEGLSLSLIEALAHGHRVVATDVGETRAFCGSVEGVRIVPAGDADRLTTTIDGMLRWTPATLAQAVAANQAHARLHGSLDGVVDMLVTLYHRTSGLTA